MKHIEPAGRGIPDLPGYRASADGVIWSCRQGSTGKLKAPWHIIRPFVGTGGYLRVRLNINNFRRSFGVHHLVLMAFHGPRPAGLYGCHNNGDPRDNRSANLRWDTPRSNQADRKRHGTAMVGSEHPQAKLTEVQVEQIRANRIRSTRSLAREFGVSRRTISDILAKRKWVAALSASHQHNDFPEVRP